jgi:predicted RNase H-like nuclease (RuvC/YqgF family)
MATREWMITKVALALGSIITIVSISVGASNVVVNMQKDITRVDEVQQKHQIKDDTQWASVHSSIYENREDIHKLELQNTRLETQFAEIMRRLDELNLKLDRFEVM